MDKQPFIKKDTLGKKAERIKNRAQPWVFKYARFGHAAKGVVYIIIGILALMTATGHHGKITNTSGALDTIARQPFGPVLLIILAIGLSGYAFWQILRAVLDPECDHYSWKRLFARLGYTIVAGIYIGICVSAIRLIVRASVQTNDQNYKSLSAKLLAHPFGQTLIALTGAAIIVIGVVYLYRSATGRFKKNFKKNEMSAKEWKWSGYLGKFGIGARSIVFCIVGFFLIRTAIYANPNETKGLDGALAKVADQPFGPYWLAIVSLGFIAYGIYMFAEAKYKRLEN